MTTPWWGAVGGRDIGGKEVAAKNRQEISGRGLQVARSEGRTFQCGRMGGGG